MLRIYIRFRKALQFLRIKITWWVIGDVALAIRKQAVAEMTRRQSAFEEQLQHHFGAWQALDVGLKDPGKIILCVRMGGQDLVEVIDVKPEMSVDEYRGLQQELKARYGARTLWADVPHGMDRRIFLDHPHPPRSHRHGH